MTERFHVFLSYSRQQNLQAAINLRTQFERAGITVFRDEDSIHEGDRWLEKLQQAVEHCDCFVLLVGSEGVQRWVGAETQVALLRHFDVKEVEQRLPLFPLLIDDYPVQRLPAFLRLIQATSWDGEQPLSEALLNHIKQKLLLSNTSTPFEACPFVGLNAYQANQAQLFFGRKKETLDALALFNSSGPGKKVKWLEINGNSGSGKSSLMNAGLLPLIDQGWLYARRRIPVWQIIGPMMPGEHPVEMLADTLTRTFNANNSKLEMADVRQHLEADNRGLAGILSKNADELIESFGSRKQQALEFLFKLVKVDPELRQHARRRLSLIYL